MTIQLRGDTAANWTSVNPVLALRQVGLELDTQKFKVGDGITAWTALSYWGGGSAWGGITGTLSAQTDLQAALDAKAATGHVHTIANVTGLQTALDGKQPLATVLTNTTAAFTTAQETKLAGIATAATANASDASLRDRATHTGTQAAATITGLATIATTGNAADLASIFASSVLGNPDGISGPVQEIGFGDFGNLIPVFTDADNGTAPASGGGTANFLRADGTWAAPASGGLGGEATVTVPSAQYDWSETVTATGVTATSKVLLGFAPHLDTDENDPTFLDVRSMWAVPGTDQITINLAFAVPARGPIKFNWSAV